MDGWISGEGRDKWIFSKNTQLLIQLITQPSIQLTPSLSIHLSLPPLPIHLCYGYKIDTIATIAIMITTITTTTITTTIIITTTISNTIITTISTTIITTISTTDGLSPSTSQQLTTSSSKKAAKKAQVEEV